MPKADDFQGFRWTEANCGRHFKLLPREIVAVEHDDDLRPGPWASLSYAAKAVLPVVLRHADERGVAYPGEGRIAAMSGVSRKTARGALRELEVRGLLGIRTRTSRAGRRCKVYQLAPCEEGVAIMSIQIDGGNWACLRPSARALAVAFWLFAKARPDLDPEHGDWMQDDDFTDYLKSRNFDFCNAEPAVLREFSGIGSRVYPDAISSLQEKHFISPDPDRPDTWRVIVWPQYVQKPAFLNSRLEHEDW